MASPKNPAFEAKHDRRPDGRFGSGGGERKPVKANTSVSAFIAGKSKAPPARPAPTRPADGDAERKAKLAAFIGGKSTRPNKKPAKGRAADLTRLAGRTPPRTTPSAKPAAPEPAAGTPLKGAPAIRRHMRAHLAGVAYTQAERDAAYAYSKDDYKEINAGLRAGKVPAKHAATVRTIDAAFARTPPLDRPVVALRGIENASRIFGPSPATGTEFVDRAYVSTTASAKIARSFETRWGAKTDTATVEIRVPAGVRALSLTPPAPPSMRSDYDEEDELLLPRGTRMRITSDKIVKGRRKIVAEVVPDTAEAA